MENEKNCLKEEKSPEICYKCEKCYDNDEALHFNRCGIGGQCVDCDPFECEGEYYNPIEDIKALEKALEKIEYAGPTKVVMIPEYFNYRFNDDPEPFFKLLKKAAKKGEKIQVMWIE